jgi:hypothetical protein
MSTTLILETASALGEVVTLTGGYLLAREVWLRPHDAQERRALRYFFAPQFSRNWDLVANGIALHGDSDLDLLYSRIAAKRAVLGFAVLATGTVIAVAARVLEAFC